MVRTGQYTVAMPPLCSGRNCRSHPFPMLLLRFDHHARTNPPASHLRRRCAFAALITPVQTGWEAERLADSLICLPATSHSPASQFAEQWQMDPTITFPRPLQLSPNGCSATSHLQSPNPVAIPRPSAKLPPSCLVRTQEPSQRWISLYPHCTVVFGRDATRRQRRGVKENESQQLLFHTIRCVSLPSATHANVLEDGRWWNERMRRAWLL